MPGTFSPVEKHEVCRMEIFLVTQTYHVPYTTMFCTDDVLAPIAK